MLQRGVTRSVDRGIQMDADGEFPEEFGGETSERLSKAYLLSAEFSYSKSFNNRTGANETYGGGNETSE